MRTLGIPQRLILDSPLGLPAMITTLMLRIRPDGLAGVRTVDTDHEVADEYSTDPLSWCRRLSR